MVRRGRGTTRAYRPGWLKPRILRPCSSYRVVLMRALTGVLFSPMGARGPRGKIGKAFHPASRCSLHGKWYGSRYAIQGTIHILIHICIYIWIFGYIDISLHIHLQRYRCICTWVFLGLDLLVYAYRYARRRFTEHVRHTATYMLRRNELRTAHFSHMYMDLFKVTCGSESW